jgi:putative transcriptional regulator
MYRRVAISLGCMAMLFVISIAAAQTNEEQRRPIVLVAAPHLLDPNFAQTVVLVMFPPESGPTGVILNRPTELQLREIWPGQEQRQGRTDTIYIGGPLQPDGLLYLFRMQPPPAHAWPVMDDIYLSGNGELLEQLVDKQAGPNADQRFFAGYSGWLPRQLEREIANGDWFVLEAQAEIIYDTDSETLWRRLYQRATLLKARIDSQPKLAGRSLLPGLTVSSRTAASRQPLTVLRQ